MKCGQKSEYASELLASNAAWLHGVSFTKCAGVQVYPCGEGADRHWHYGHACKADSDACRAVTLPPPFRPARWRLGRRFPSKRPAKR